MFAANADKHREDLLQEISKVLQQWPEMERNIFSQAHYQGRSVEDISRSLELEREEVSRILIHCGRRLLLSLRNFRKIEFPPAA